MAEVDTVDIQVVVARKVVEALAVAAMSVSQQHKRPEGMKQQQQQPLQQTQQTSVGVTMVEGLDAERMEVGNKVDS